MSRLHNDLLNALGPNGFLSNPDAMAPYLAEPRNLYPGKALGVARPNSVELVSRVVNIVQSHNAHIVPQAGNTGLTGAQSPQDPKNAVVLSVERLNSIINVNPLNNSLVAQAGCILDHIHEAAHKHDRLFPLTLGSHGSCQIGGLASTNAGGVHVLKYGMMRDLILGLQVVLPNGNLWNGLSTLRKNNAGLDLKHLFIGAEGSMGIITALALKLHPAERSSYTAFLAVKSPKHAVEALQIATELSGGALHAFELISSNVAEITASLVERIRNPLPNNPLPWRVLLEFASPDSHERLTQIAQPALEAILNADLADDAVVASSQAHADDFWRLREEIPEGLKRKGAVWRHDISVPVHSVPSFIQLASDAVLRVAPNTIPVPFGHVGDGNIHFNLVAPPNLSRERFFSLGADVSRVVHDIAHELHGSISAEHGIGLSRLHELPRYKSHAELQLLRVVKNALDPQNTFNPGKMIPPEGVNGVDENP